MINAILKDNDRYIIIKDYDSKIDFFTTYECNKDGKIIDNDFVLLIGFEAMKQMEVVKIKIF